MTDPSPANGPEQLLGQTEPAQDVLRAFEDEAARLALAAQRALDALHQRARPSAPSEHEDRLDLPSAPSGAGGSLPLATPRADDLLLSTATLPTAARGTVLAVDDDPRILKLIAVALRRAGYEVTLATDGHAALARIAEATPDLIISDVMMPGLDGLGLLTQVRAHPATRSIPLILLTAKNTTEDLAAGLGLGADDYLAKPFVMAELLARVQAKIDRPSIPADLVPHDRQTGLLTERAFWRPLERELQRAAKTGRPGALVYLSLEELPRLQERLGPRATAAIVKQLAALLMTDARPIDVAMRDAAGRFGLLLPEIETAAVEERLTSLTRRLIGQVFHAGAERVQLTPVIGYAPFAAVATVERLRDQALIALSHAALHLDLRPLIYAPTMQPLPPKVRRSWRVRLEAGLRVPLQIALTFVVGMGLPFALYVGLYQLGVDISTGTYLVVVAALLTTAYFIWLEGFHALKVVHPPTEPGSAYPAASAIIAAYLPNEAATVVETVEAFLRVEYPGPLQIILAYNTPRDLPVEATLQEIGRRDPRFLPLRVPNSTSKAQNVNVAVAQVTGQFVGVFDADHHPQPDSFTRAWRWLASGYDVVQGHCLIRNGDDSWVARLVAVEFEAIYAVAHPGRSRLHGFGIFGGSNGYWKTSLLRQTRMRGTMLTEDIDSSLRAVEGGYRIASDPALISRELGPVTLKAVWNQRMRWAQGWFQVSLRHITTGLCSPQLTVRQKLGFVHLLAWREVYPWISFQMFPIILFWIWRDGFGAIHWFVPIWVLTSIFTLATGPSQTLFTYLLAAPEIRRRGRWMLFYLVVNVIFYAEYKNLIARVAQVKEFMGDRSWKVTPRSAKKSTS